MKNWRKSGIVGFLLMVSVLFISGCQTKETSQSSEAAKTVETTQATKEKETQSTTPTLFFLSNLIDSLTSILNFPLTNRLKFPTYISGYS